MKILLILALFGVSAFSCSSFQLRGAEHVYYGKSYDWDETHGALIFNTVGLKKTAVVSQNPEVWTSKLASLTFNQPGQDFPQGGINEKGLVVEVMIGSMQTQKESNLKRINELQWVQRILDLAGNTEEALELASQVTIEKIVVDLHYLICDREEVCATVEHIKGVPVIHKGIKHAVLTNSDYAPMESYLSEFVGFGGKKQIPSGPESHSRFVRVASFLNSYNSEEPLAYMWDILDSVKGGTSWQIVYDQTANKIQFKVRGIEKLQEVEFPKLSSYSCRWGLKALDLKHSRKQDEVTFYEYSKEWNAYLVDQTSHATEEMKRMLKYYPNTVECTDSSNLRTL